MSVERARRVTKLILKLDAIVSAKTLLDTYAKSAIQQSSQARTSIESLWVIEEERFDG